MYNIQTFYGWQTQYKCVMSTHKIFYEYTQMCPHSTTKYTANIREIHTLNHEMRANIPPIIYVRPRNTQRISVNYPITHKIHNEHSANYLHRPRNTQRTHR